jgi:hypothetical protein
VRSIPEESSRERPTWWRCSFSSSLLLLVLEFPRWFEEEGRERGRNNGESVGDRKVTPRGCEFRPEVEYFQRANLLESSRLGALLYPEETLKQLDMGARGRLQGEVRT